MGNIATLEDWPGSWQATSGPSGRSPFPIENQIGIEPDRRVVDEYPAVDFADIDAAQLARGDNRDRLIDSRWYLEIFGEVISMFLAE